MQIHVVVNGERRHIPQGQSVQALLESMRIDPARVAVEMDRRIVKPKDWPGTVLADGAALEIVQFVGGG
jgi:thiamine biosynthesis protein ThiS